VVGALASGPRWAELYARAAEQQGLFTTRQAAEAGYSPQLLIHHVRVGNVARLQRGIYRLVHFPSSEHEELVRVWLWSEREGVMSHRTALSLHGLSDVLPAEIDLTVPSAWRRRRLRRPGDVALHFADVTPEDRGWFGAVPVTTPLRTLHDCAEAALSPEHLTQAVRQALRRGLVERAQLQAIEQVLAPFGGIGR